ncbi:glucans biosynthesis protein [Rhizobiales bacterium GAS188]|nr:glucans biosynthesis protein [Rhizobiales bacterium GAS188]
MNRAMTRRGMVLSGLGLAAAPGAIADLAPASILASGPLLTSGSFEAAFAQTPAGGPAPPRRFGYDEVVARAKEIASVPFDSTPAQLPGWLADLDYDGWRDLRFRPEKAFFQSPGGLFRLQLFHLGFNFKRAVTVNIMRNGAPAPIAYSQDLFDFGRTVAEKPLPANTGFGGLRLHYPLNQPKLMDELIAFLGASYFRFLGRDQLYGLSARGLAVNAGVGRKEEFPFFREFWIEEPAADADMVIIHALLDGESVTGAYRFAIYPGIETMIETQVTLFARRRIDNLGLAPLTSMFLTAENDRRVPDNYRREVHDSDGLLMRAGSGEWIWRPLRNPAETTTSTFVDKDIGGFGLLQRDRAYEHYQDIEVHYERRPSYWVEPLAPWGEGALELTEIATQNEYADNIVAAWRPKSGLEPAQSLAYGYRIYAKLDAGALLAVGQVQATFQMPPKASGAPEPDDPGKRRFLIDFAGGDLPYYLKAQEMVEVVASVSAGRVTRTSLTVNPAIKGFRATVDVALEAGQSGEVRAYLRARKRPLTETWTFPYRRPAS